MDKGNGEVDNNNVVNKGFELRHNYIIKSSNPKGTFGFKIPLKHFLGFCEDYKKSIIWNATKININPHW